MKNLMSWFKDPGVVEFCDSCSAVTTKAQRQHRAWEAARTRAISSGVRGYLR